MNQVLAALVNGAALGAVVTIAVWLVLRLAPRRQLNAATRYMVWWATLAIVLALPALYWPHRVPVVPVAAPSPTAPTQRSARQQAATVSPAATSSDTTRSLTVAVPIEGVPLENAALFPPVPNHPIQIPADRWPRLLFFTWLAAAIYLLTRLAVSCALLARTSRRAYDVPHLLTGQARQWLTRRSVRVAVSAEIATPVAAGPYRPSILIPAALLDELDATELQQIGLHEAAHLARYDDCAILLQRLIEAILALHPVVRWITRQIDLEREIACDDLVIAATGQPRSYAHCLTRIVEHSVGIRPSLAAAGAAEDRSHLARRIDLLLDKTRSASTRLFKLRLAAIVAAVSTLGWAAGHAPGLVVFASPLARAVRAPIVRQSPLRLSPPMMPRAVEAPQPAAPDFEARVIEDSTGNPMASAEVRFRKAGMRELAADLDTDRQGRARVSGIAAGEYTLEVVKPNYVAASVKVQVPTTALTIRLVRYGAISGQITDQQGQPVPAYIRAPGGRTVGGSRIAILARDKGAEELHLLREAQIEEGRYRIHDLTPGEYFVGLWYDALKDGSGIQLYPDNVHPRAFLVSGGDEFSHIDFQILPNAGYRVSGKVELPAAGKPFALALGLPSLPALPIAQTLSDSDGSFHFEKVPPGTYDLFAGGPSTGYGAHDNAIGPEPRFGRTQVSVSGQNVEGLSIPVSPARPLKVVLHAFGLPRGSTETPAGCPATATVGVTALEPWGLFFSGTTQAGFGKEQSLPNIAPGRFQVAAVGLSSGCYQARPAVVDLSRDTPETVTVELTSAGSIRGTLRVETGSVKDYAVVLLDAEGTPDSMAQLAYPDAQGRFVLQGLRPGHYRVATQLATEASRARWIADVSRLAEVDVAGGAPTELDLRVPGPAKEGRQ